MIANRFKMLGKVAGLLLASLQMAQAVQEYEYDRSGSLIEAVTSGSALAPSIVHHPVSAKIEVGAPLSLSVTAAGTPPFTYQWYKGIEPVENATGPTLVFPSLSAADAGSYTVKITNSVSNVTSDPAVLSLPPNTFAAPLGGPTAADWIAGGTSIWREITDPASTHDGVSAIGSGQVFEDASYFQGNITVAEPSTVVFWMKITGEGSVSVKRDGLQVIQAFPYQTTDWKKYQIHLQPGTAFLQWHYSTNYGGSITMDDLAVIPAEDTDSDGVSDAWETEFFGDLTHNGTTDDDSDSNDNLTEYLDHTNPKDNSSMLTHLKVTIHGNGTVAASPVEPHLGYKSGDHVDVSVTPAEGHVFAGWAGLTESNLSSVGLDFYTASFHLDAYFSPAIPLAEAADTTGVTWTTGGDAPWVGQNRETSDNVDALMSGSSPHGDGIVKSWVQCTIVGPKKVTFDFLFRDETSLNTLVLEVDGLVLPILFQSPAWQNRTVFIPPGSHTMRWTQTQFDPDRFNWSISGLDKVTVTTPADTDADGLPDEWETDLMDTLDQTGSGDYDNDGATNAQEYALFTHPYNPASRRHQISLATEGSGTATVSPGRPLYLYGDQVRFAATPGSGQALLEWEGLPDAHDEEFYQTVYTDLGVTAIFAPEDDLNKALDNDNVTFENSIPGWRKTTDVSHDGVDAAQTPVLTHSHSAHIILQVTGPKVLSFWWKSQKNSYTTLYDNGNVLLSIDGDTSEWQRQFVQLPAGNHTLKWLSVLEASATVWLDQVQVEVDTDQDGLPDSWETTNFGSLTPVANGDPDNDNSDNQTEWGDGTDPNSASSAKYRLTVIRNEKASVQISPEKLDYLPGDEVTITADPAFLDWTGDAAGTANPLVVTMNASKTINANFHPVAEGADNTQLVFVNGGSDSWTRESTGGIGNDAAYSGTNLTAGQDSWVQTTVTGPATISFNATASLASGNSYFAWTIDGNEVERLISSSSSNKSFIVTPGTHTIRWTYHRGSDDYSWEGGSIDDLKYAPITGFIGLDTALDTTDVTWTSGVVPSWVGAAATTHDGVDAAHSLPIGSFGSAGLSTTVNLATNNELSFWWKVSSEENYDRLTFLVNGVEPPAIPSISGETGWTKAKLILPAGTHTLKWTYSKDSFGEAGEDRGWVDEVTLTALPSLPAALDTSGITWTTGGDAIWFGMSNLSHDGVDSAASGDISSFLQQSWLQGQFTGPGTLSFWWKVSSVSNSDFLDLFLDSSFQDAITGESGWVQKSISIPSGTHTVQWTYYKNGSASAGLDGGFLDQVSFVATPPPPVTISFPFIGTRQFSLQSIALRATASNGAPVTYSVSGPARLSGSSLILTGLGNVTVVARSSGKQSTQTFKVTDTTAPKLSDTTRSVSTSGSSATVRGRASDNHQVPGLYYRVKSPNGKTSQYKKITVGSAPGQKKSFSFKVSLPDPGAYTVEMYCKDVTGNKSSVAKTKITKR